MALVSKINKEIAGAASAAKQVAQKAAKATSRDKDKRDEFDASARSNYAARTQSVSTPKSGYFSLQSTKQQGERLANTVGAFEAATAKSAKALQTANDEATRLGKALQQKSTQLKELEGYANQPNSGIAKSIYNKAVGEYGELQSAYETAASNAAKAWEEYEPLYNKYAQAADEYDRYQKQSQETYRDWKSRIRSHDKIQTEAQQTDRRLKELTAKRDELTGEAQRLNGIAYGTTGSRAQRQQWQTQAETATQEADRLQRQIDELTQKQGLLKEEEDWSKYFGYQDLMSEQDFREKSAYKSTANGKTRSIMDRLTDNFEESGYDDPLYEYINGNQEAGAFLRNRAGEDYGEAGTLGNLFGRATEGNQESQQMTEDEIAIYNYLYATKGKEAASEYYDYLEGDLNYRQRKTEEEYWKNYAQESPGMASVFSILTSPAKGLSYVAQAADYIGTGEIDQNEAYNRFSYAPGAIRQQVTEDVEKKWGKVGSFAYQTGMSMADFLFTNLVSGGFSGFASGSAAQKLTEGIALGIMGSGAAADSVIQAKDRGVDDGMAFALGTIAGGAEIFTEKFSIEALLEGKMEKSAIQYILKNAFTEGTEEVGSDIINLMADVIIAKDKSEWMRAVEAYKEKGMTDSEAFGHAVGDQAMQMLLDAAGGALSGGFMGGGGAAISSINQQSTYAQTGETLRMLGDDVTKSIIDNGLQAGKETSAYKLAEKLQKKMQKNQSISNADIGKLFAMTGMPETQTAASTETKQEAEQEGIMLPTAEEAENAQRTAEIAQPGAENAQPITENAQPITENAQPITEPGMLPTAEEAERKQRIRGAGTELERSAIENNVSDELYQRTQRISEAIGRDVRFYTAEDAAENGYYDNDTGIIYVNANSQNPVAQIISHELTHSIEGADAYQKLQGIILNRIEQSGRNIDAMRRRKENLYAQHGKTLTPEAINQEIIAEYVERNLLTDEQSIRELVSADRTVGQRILDWLDGLLAKIGVESAQERAFVRNARDLYAQALQQNQTQTTEQTAEDVMSRTMAMMQSSFGGRNANRADLDALQQAQEMQLRNVDPETIRRETGWFTGADGKWRFEIDDSGMEYRRNGDAKFAQDPEYNEYLDLWNKAYRDGDASDEEIERMRDLDKKYGRVGQVYALSMANGFATLDDIIVHDELFENYPQLRETKVEFADLGGNVAGQYNRDTDTITLSYRLRNAPEDTLVHEIQHAIQREEGFASGASVEYWRDRSGRGAEDEYVRQFANLTDEQQSEWNRYQDLERTLRNLFLQDGSGEEYRRYEAEQDALYDRLYQEQWFRDMLDAEAERLDEEGKVNELYLNTAGEIEARDAASRRKMTAEERRDNTPNARDENTVFAETEEDVARQMDENHNAEFSMSTWKSDGRRALENYLVTQVADGELEGADARDILSRLDEIYIASPEYRDVEQIHADEGRLRDADDFNQIMMTLEDDLKKAVRDIAETSGKDAEYMLEEQEAILEIIAQAARGSRTAANIRRTFQSEGYRITDRQAQEVKKLLDYAASAPTKYFEAKPQRVVGFDEALAIIAPTDAPIELVAAIRNAGMNVIDYEAGNDQSRLDAIRSVEGAQFSYGREDRQEILQNMRSILNRGGSAAELRRYIDSVDNNRIDLPTYEQTRNEPERIVRDAHRQGLDVREYINRNWEQYELDGEMNEDARAAVDLERQQSRRRYSLDENPADETTEELRSKTTDSFLNDLTEGQQIEPEREDLERMRQRDLDEFWQEAIRAADVLEPRTLPEDKVSTAAQKKQRTRREKASEAWSYFKRKMVDSGEAVTRIGKAANDRNLYHYYNMARSSSNAATSMILKERTDISGRATGKGLNDVMDAIRKKGDDYYKKFQLYMFHQHNIDRMSRFSQERVDSAQAALEYYRLANPEVTKYADFQLERMANDETSPLYFEAGEYIALRDALRTAENTKDKPVFGFDVSAEDSRGIVQTLEQENPDFQAEAEEVYGYIENLLRYRVDSGLISEQDYNTLKTMYPHYVPTYRVFEKGTDTSETNRVRVGSTIRRATGSSEKIMPLHKALAQQTMSVVREGSKNRFGMRLMDFGRNVKEHVRDIHEFRDQFNENTFDLPEDDTFKKRNTFVVREDGKLWEIEVSPALYEAVQALSPETPENNVLFNVLRKGNNLYKSLITGYNPTFTVRNFFRDMADAGLYSKNSAEFAKQYPQAVREIAKDGKYWRQYQALGGTYSTIFDYETGETDRGSKLKQKTLGRIEALNMAVEQAPRLAEFMATVKKAEAAHGAATMDDLMEAMYNAADITVNFGRSGTIGKQLNATVAPFLNPGIQGFDKMIRNVTETKGAKEWAKLAVKVAALGIAPTIINSLIYHDDEDWEALKDRDKDVNYLFKIGDHTWLKIPKGRTLSVIGMAADRTGDKLKGEDVDWSEFISTVVSQTAPSNPLTTNIAAPMVQTKLFDPDNPGTTWYGGDIENQRMQSYAPAERYDSSTDALSKFLGKTFNLSPAKINYLLDQYTGVVGDVLLPMTSAAPQRDMFSDAFTIDSNRSNRYSNDFYARLDELQYAKNATDADAVDSIVYKYWNRQSQAVSDINKAIRKIEEDQTISKKEKQELLDVQYAMRNEIIRSAMDYYEDYVNAVTDRYNESSAEDEEARADEAYRAANRDVLGTEYALKTYNSSVYKTAQEMAEKGVDYDTFYDFYFRNKAAKDSNEKREILMDLDVSDEQKKALYTKYISDGRQDDIDAFAKAGMDFNTYMEAQNEYTTASKMDGSSSEKRTEFAAWVYDQKLTEDQRKTIMDSFAFYSHIPADQGRYEDLINLGIDKDAAYEISSKLGDLQPEAGKYSVSGEQKWRVIIDSGLSPQDQLTALEAVTSEPQRRKFNAAYQFGIDPEIYLRAKEALPKFDSDGNGSYRYAEIEDMLRSFGGSGLQLPGAQNVTNEEKAVLWQLITGSSSARNNPYSSAIGWKVIDAVNNQKPRETNDVSGLLKLPK